jgi:hypothetical protein
MGVKNQDDPKAAEATDELYMKENAGGKMLLGQWSWVSSGSFSR